MTESPDRESSSRADEYTRNFLQGEALPTIWQELAFHRRFLPDITLAEINALAAHWFPEQNRLVIVPLPRPPASPCPTRRSSPPPSRRPRRSSVEALRRRRRRPGADGRAAGARHDREDDAAAGGRHHRVDAVERRDGRAQADDAEGRSDPVPRLRARRHVARERRRLHRRRAPPTTSCRRAASASSSAVDARQDAHRQGGGRDAVHRRDRARAWPAAARRRISRRCSSCCYLRFTQPRADPTAFAALSSQAQGAARQPHGEPRRRVRPDDRRRAQPATARGGSPRPPRRWTSGTCRSRWPSTRRASPTPATSRSSSSAASRPRCSSRSSRPTSRACRRRTPARPGATSGITPPTRRRREDDREGHRAEEPGGDRLLRARSCTTTRTCWRCGR